MIAKQPSVWGLEFEATMKALKLEGKPAGRMQTWFCPEDKIFHVLTGTPDCTTCSFYESRVEL